MAKIVPAIFDLSTALRLSDQFDHPEVLAAVARIEAAAHRARMTLAGVAFTRAQAETLLAGGYPVVAARNVSTTLRQWVFEFRLGLAPFSLAG